LWSNIKETADSSTAPAFIHAEDDVIKRCIRDVYNGTIMNRSQFSKFGITVAELVATMRPVERRAAA
jgi:Ribonuclease G/E